ncbi:hypothetical protein NDU88_003803 [Pleurodeles waltl]|uniref:Ig-like domain-containing protein n=1 Tax=Pleurodeles waltl TaxID=8319 RepID=A0AAV7QA10_PLEWA|nr:hypothetical protein NDU88_003803 [Pleurodeles waltl]
MIQQLIDISQEQYERHKLEVDQLTQRIDEANWGDISIKNYAILNNVIDNYEADIIQRKNRKFRRDLRDYQQGRVYTFSKKYDHVQDSNPPSDTMSCPDTIPSLEIETSDDSEGDPTTRPRVNFLEEARRFRLGSLQESRVLPQVTLQESGPGTVKPSETLKLTCKVTGFSITTSGSCWYWIRQPPGKGLEWLGRICASGSTYYSEPLKSRLSATSDTSLNEFYLQMSNMRAEDTATFYCARESQSLFAVWGPDLARVLQRVARSPAACRFTSSVPFTPGGTRGPRSLLAVWGPDLARALQNALHSPTACCFTSSVPFTPGGTHSPRSLSAVWGPDLARALQSAPRSPAACCFTSSVPFTPGGTRGPRSPFAVWGPDLVRALQSTPHSPTACRFTSSVPFTPGGTHGPRSLSAIWGPDLAWALQIVPRSPAACCFTSSVPFTPGGTRGPRSLSAV